jgi:D-serine deaminase-like pyridoxal phosphate-dependent protein
MSPWYSIANAHEIDSPALLVYPDRARENTRRMIAAAGGTERLRPHVKTHKMAEMVRMQMELGVTRFKTATLAEAEMAAQCGAADVLLAYHAVGPKVDRLARLIARYPGTRFSALADDEAALRHLSQGLSRANVQAEILLDIDNGMGRTGVVPGPRAIELYKLLGELPGLLPGGLHVYDGHIRDRDLAARVAHADKAFAPVEELRRQLRSAGCLVPRVVAGGTPTFPCHARRSDVESSPGTCIFWDANYGGKFPDLEFLHAAVLMTRVISRPGSGRVCLDLGYKAVSPDNPDPRVVFFDAPDAKTIVHNEEHLTIEARQAGDWSVGDVVYGIPYHVCPTVALHQFAVVVRDGWAVERWKVVARDRFLTV